MIYWGAKLVSSLAAFAFNLGWGAKLVSSLATFAFNLGWGAKLVSSLATFAFNLGREMSHYFVTEILFDKVLAMIYYCATATGGMFEKSASFRVK